MPATRTPTRPPGDSGWHRLGLQLRLGTVVAVGVAVCFVAAAAWSFAGSSPALASLMLLIAVLVVTPPLAGWARRRDAVRRFRAVDGATSVRWAQRGDGSRIRDTIDASVLDALGWTSADVDDFCEHLIGGVLSGVLVVLEPGDRVIGVVRVIPVSVHPRAVRLVVWIDARRRRLGHATRAVGLALSSASVGVRAIGEAERDDLAAQRLAAAAGFERAADSGDRANFVRRPDRDVTDPGAGFAGHGAPRHVSQAMRNAVARPALTGPEVGALVDAASPLTDGGTTLRRSNPTDADDVVGTIDDAVLAAMGWTDEIRRWYGTSVAVDLAHELVVVTVPDADRAGGRVAGVVVLQPVPQPADASRRRVRVGFWMGAGARGDGHMSRAVSILTRLVHDDGIEAFGETGVDNVPAQRVFANAGFVETGRRPATLPNGATMDGVAYEYRAAT